MCFEMLTHKLRYVVHDCKDGCRLGTVPVARFAKLILLKAGPPRHIDEARLTKCLDNSNVIITAQDGDKLVGFLRAITDFSYVAYAASAAVDPDYRRRGIWRRMNELLKERLGAGVTILALSRKESAPYFPAIGFHKTRKAWIMVRKE